MTTNGPQIAWEHDEIPFGTTLQGMADLAAPHFGGDRHLHHYRILEVADRVVLLHTPETTEEEGARGPRVCLNGWGRGDAPFFEDDDRWSAPTKAPRATARSPYQILNQLRDERGLPRASRPPRRGQVTRAMVRQICIDVWREKYPRALTDADFVLGELTVKLVEQEVERRIAILKGQLIPLRR